MTEPDRPMSADPNMGPPYAGPPAPARRRRTGLIVAGIVAAVAVALTVGAGVTVLVLRTRSPTNVAAAAPTTEVQTSDVLSPSATPSPTVTAKPPYTGRLQDLAIPKPAGAVYTPKQRRGDADGSLSLQQLAGEYDGSSTQADIAKRLTDLKYQRGIFLAWRESNGTLVYLQIFQFGTDAGAAEWTTYSQGSFGGPETIAIAGIGEIEGAKLFTNQFTNSKGVAGTGTHAIYNKGAFVVWIDAFNPAGPDANSTKAMAVDQYHRLP